MKIVTYMGSKEKFFLTNDEFEDASIAWNEGKHYFCQRLQSRLSPHTLFVRNLELQLIYDIFIELNGNGGKIHDVVRDKTSGEYSVLKENEDGNDYFFEKKEIKKKIEDAYIGCVAKDSSKVPEVQEWIKKLIPIEDYFNNHRAIETAILLKLK